MSKISQRLCAFSMLFLCTGAPVSAGELNPPAGPVAATGVTLLNNQWTTLPYTITESGTYRLTSDLAAGGGTHGIIVGADNVTIDLNGFSLIGGSGDAIRPDQGNFQNISVSNGVIQGWTDSGIRASFMQLDPPFENGSLRFGHFDNLKVINCGGNGISAPGGSVITNCVVSQCGGNGIVVIGGIVSKCVSQDNAGSGLFASESVVISECVSSDNLGAGLELINSGQTIVNSAFLRNEGGGIHRLTGATVQGCTIANNQMFGISIVFFAKVTDNQITSNQGDGIFGTNVSPSGDNQITDNIINANSGWGVNFPNNSGNHFYRNVIKRNVTGAINALGSDAPLSPSSAGAGPWDNIGP